LQTVNIGHPDVLEDEGGALCVRATGPFSARTKIAEEHSIDLAEVEVRRAWRCRCACEGCEGSGAAATHGGFDDYYVVCAEGDPGAVAYWTEVGA